MSKQAIIRNIESFLVRMLIHLIKNQIEQRLTNSWAALIRGSIIEIKKLNLQDNKTSYYVKSDEWQPMLEDALEIAINPITRWRRLEKRQIDNIKLTYFERSLL